MKRNLLFSPVVALVLCAPFVINAEDAVMVPVFRPEKVGDMVKQRIEAEESTNMLITAGGEKLDGKVDEWKASVEVSRKTEKVNEKGAATELTLEFHKFSVTRGEETKDELEAGTVVKAMLKDGEEVFEVDGEAVEESVRAVLASVIEMDSKSKGDENKAYGVDKPRKVGEEWGIDVEEMLATMPDNFPMTLNKDSIKGDMKLVEIVGEGDESAAKLESTIEMTIDNLKGMPPGTEIEPSTIKVSLEGLFPLDTKRPAAMEGMKMIMDFKSKIPMPDGGKADMTLVASTKKVSEIIP